MLSYTTQHFYFLFSDVCRHLQNWDNFNPILGIEIFLVNQWLKVWLQSMQFWCFHDLCICNKATVKFSSLKQQAFYLFAYNVVIGLDLAGAHFLLYLALARTPQL